MERETYEVELLEMLKKVAPGSLIRDGLENVLRAKTGGLIVIGDSEEVLGIVDGGFVVNTFFSPSKLYELAKMDGAIVINSDMDRILCANAQLVPDSNIPSDETGSRHKAAQRVARQTEELVIAISQRRDIITLYYKDLRYILVDIRVLLAKANQAVMTLEKYRTVLDQALTDLGALEFEDLVTLSEVATVIQRTEMVLRIGSEIERYIIELGIEGRLIEMQMKELLATVEEEGLLVIKDYYFSSQEDEREDHSKPQDILMDLSTYSSEDLLSLTAINKRLGYSSTMNDLDRSVTPKGYRLLKKIPRLPMSVIENLVTTFGNLQEIISASTEELDEVDGIGEVRANAIKEGLRRLRDQVLLDRHI